MDTKTMIKIFRANDFIKIINKSDRLIKGATIYAKEIRKNIFLLFVLEKEDCQKINALIASFDSLESIGISEPIQLMFFLSISKDEDIHFFEKYLKLQKT